MDDEAKEYRNNFRLVAADMVGSDMQTMGYMLKEFKRPLSKGIILMDDDEFKHLAMMLYWLVNLDKRYMNSIREVFENGLC